MQKDHIEELSKLIGAESVVTDQALMLAANKPKRYGSANSNYLALVTVQTEADLSRVLKYCDANNVKIVPRSGGTALTKGSSIDETRPKGDYILLKLYTPEKIRPPEILDNGARVKIYPGNTTKELNPQLAQLGYTFPVDLGIGDKEGEAQMLGYLATNAAGTGAAFKGRAGDIVQSIRVALADGRIIDISKDSRKVPGLPQMNDIIGMGGTTGIIIEAEVEMVKLAKKRQVAVVRIENIWQMYDLLEAFKKNAWENLNLFERLNPELFAQVVKFTKRQNNRDTVDIEILNSGDILFIELTSTNEKADLLSPLRKSLKECNLDGKAIIARDEKHGDFLLGYRVVNASVACDDYARKTGGETVAFDISVPVEDDREFPSQKLVDLIRQHIPGVKIFSFGHAAGVEKISAETGRGGTAVHFNPVVPANTPPEAIAWLREVVFREINGRGGKIVSEHTPGTKLTHYMEKYQPDQYARDIAKVAKYNPNCTLNPGAYVNPLHVAKQVREISGK